MTNRKKNKVETVEEPQVATDPTEMEMIQKVLDEAKNKDLHSVLVIGMKPDGKLDISTDRPHFPFLHWLLNRTIFELNILENNNMREVK